MISTDKVREAIFEIIDGEDYFIVSLNVSPQNKIKLEIDRMQGITIEEIVKLSRTIERSFDREEEDFELEVLSPGVGQPLVVKEQYIKNVDRFLSVQYQDGATIEGQLTKADEKSIVLHTSKKVKLEGKKRKTLVEEDITINYEDINIAKVMVKF